MGKVAVVVVNTDHLDQLEENPEDFVHGLLRLLRRGGGGDMGSVASVSPTILFGDTSIFVIADGRPVSLYDTVRYDGRMRLGVVDALKREGFKHVF